MKQIKNKREFYKLWENLQLGNKPRTWNKGWDIETVSILSSINPNSKYSIRHLKNGSNLAVLGIDYDICIDYLRSYYNKGVTPEELRINECPDDTRLVLQGEIYRNEQGLILTYSTTPCMAMREAMRQPLVAANLKAKAILEKWLNWRSLTMIEDIMEEYDGVIEFSTYSYNLGIMDKHNTLIWEVRNY